MTYILAHSVTGVYDVTRRYVKNREIIEKKRNKTDVERSAQLLREKILDIIDLLK
jgi:hypothetical protein